MVPEVLLGDAVYSEKGPFEQCAKTSSAPIVNSGGVSRRETRAKASDGSLGGGGGLQGVGDGSPLPSLPRDGSMETVEGGNSTTLHSESLSSAPQRPRRPLALKASLSTRGGGGHEAPPSYEDILSHPIALELAVRKVCAARAR